MNEATIENHLISLTPFNEQQYIIAMLDELMKYSDELEQSIKDSQERNDILLQQGLSEALEPKENSIK